jgi:hypothetical protein
VKEDEGEKSNMCAPICWGLLALLAIVSLILGILFAFGVIGNKGADYSGGAVPISGTTVPNTDQTAYMFPPKTVSHKLGVNGLTLSSFSSL